MGILKLIDDQIYLHESMGLKPISIEMTDSFFELFKKELKEFITVNQNGLLEYSILKYRGIYVNSNPYHNNVLASHHCYFTVKSHYENDLA